jgi:hypothetical protein
MTRRLFFLSAGAISALLGLFACERAETGAGGSGELSSATIDVSVEKMLDIPAGSSAWRASRAASSRSRDGAMVAWRTDEQSPDDRRGELVYVSRLAATGELLDPEGIPVYESPRSSWPSLALDYDGEGHVLLSIAAKMELRRIGADGHMVDAPPVVLEQGATGDKRFGGASLGFDGVSHTVLWSVGPDVRAVRFAKDLTLGTQAPIVVGTARTPDVTPPSFAGTGGLGIAAWVERAGIGRLGEAVVRQIAADGTVKALELSKTPAANIAVGSDGKGFLVARLVPSDQGLQVDIQRLSGTGEPLDPTPLVIDTDPRNELDGLDADSDALEVTFDGARYLVTWRVRDRQDRPLVRLQRVAPSGPMAESPPATLPGYGYAAVSPSAAVATIVTKNDARGLTSVRVDETLKVTGQSLIGVRKSVQEALGIGWNGSFYIVVYADDRMSDSLPPVARRIYFERVTPDGAPIGGPVLLGDDYPADGEVDISSDGKDFLVLVRGTYSPDFRARRVRGTDGVVLDATPIAFRSPSAQYPTNMGLAFDGTSYGVAWMTGLGGGNLYLQRIAPGGALADPNPVVLARPGTAAGWSEVAASSLDGALVVVWQQGCDNCDKTIQGVRVRGDHIEPMDVTNLGRPFYMGPIYAAARDDRILVATYWGAASLERTGAGVAASNREGKDWRDLYFDGTSFLEYFPVNGPSHGDPYSFTLRQLAASGAVVPNSDVTFVGGVDVFDVKVGGGAGGRSLVAYNPIGNGARLPGIAYRTVTSHDPPVATHPEGGAAAPDAQSPTKPADPGADPPASTAPPNRAQPVAPPPVSDPAKYPSSEPSGPAAPGTAAPQTPSAKSDKGGGCSSTGGGGRGLPGPLAVLLSALVLVRRRRARARV